MPILWTGEEELAVPDSVSRDWLRRYWSGQCDGHVVDQHLSREAPRPRQWDSVIDYTRLLESRVSPSVVEKIQNRLRRWSILLAACGRHQ